MMALKTMMMVIMRVFICWYHTHTLTHTHTERPPHTHMYTHRRNSSTRGTTATTLGLKTESFTSRKLLFSFLSISDILQWSRELCKFQTENDNYAYNSNQMTLTADTYGVDLLFKLNVDCRLLLYFLKKLVFWTFLTLPLILTRISSSTSTSFKLI